FFQAEDGIRDGHVTGVQTCALPISSRFRAARREASARSSWKGGRDTAVDVDDVAGRLRRAVAREEGDRLRDVLGVDVDLEGRPRSEERRVGKECRYRGGRAE